jgi:TrmH family RNA methyltransferase
MNYIKSRSNKEISDVARLISERKERHAQGLFVAEGKRAVSTLLQAGTLAKKLYILESLIEEINVFKLLCDSYNLNQDIITLVSSAVISKISDTTSPSGIVGVFAIPQEDKEQDLRDGVVLANITSPGNMGTIIRTAAALGKKTVVVIQGCDVFSPKVVQASAGSLALVNIMECSWQELLERKKNIPLCALVVQGGENPKAMNLKESLLVVGNEAHGLPQEWIADCEKKISLPMPGKVESLNAALAVSIVMYLAYL